MRILLTGATGQFGRAFQEVAAGHTIKPLLHRVEPGSMAPVIELSEPSTVTRWIKKGAADWLVHPAGITNVDECEKDPAQAMRVNAMATGVLAKACQVAKIRFLYVSTDYVFDGENGPYEEDESTGPINAYGRSKLEGEREALANDPNALVCRTCVVFGPHKKNFVTWSATELKAGRPIRVVSDQRISPTYSYDGARQALRLMEVGAHGVYHTAGATRMTRIEMVQKTAEVFGLDAKLIQPTPSKDLGWLARRPRDSSLSVRKVSAIQPPMPFEAALQDLKKRWKP